MAKKGVPDDIVQKLESRLAGKTRAKGTPGTPNTPGTLARGTLGTPGTPEYVKKTYIIRSEYVEKLKALAYWERRELKELIDDALGQYLEGKDIPTK